MNQLESLKRWTKVVADTGDWEAIKQFKPEEATTNPSLILKVLQDKKNWPLINQAKEWLYAMGEDVSQTQRIIESLLALIGQKILQEIPGRVSTEVDAHFSFDVQETFNQAKRLIALYESLSISRKRVLIKIAATWEGIQAAKLLEKEGIACNLTLIFEKTQAIACAEAGVTLISPFVGRIYDWYKEHNLLSELSEDPGVHSVKEIYAYFKKYGYTTEIMGASFRNMGQIISLAGCDRLTISPTLLRQLSEQSGEVTPVLNFGKNFPPNPHKKIDEACFRWNLNENPMAVEKLAEGIRLFARDTMRLQALIQEIETHG